MPVRWIELNSHWFIPAGYILKILPGFPLGVSCTKYPVETHKFQELDRKKTLMCWMRQMRSSKTEFLPGQTEFALECALGFHQNPGDIWGNTQETTKHDQQFKFSWKVCFSREAHNLFAPSTATLRCFWLSLTFSCCAYFDKQELPCPRTAEQSHTLNLPRSFSFSVRLHLHEI